MRCHYIHYSHCCCSTNNRLCNSILCNCNIITSWCYVTSNVTASCLHYSSAGYIYMLLHMDVVQIFDYCVFFLLEFHLSCLPQLWNCPYISGFQCWYRLKLVVVQWLMIILCLSTCWLCLLIDFFVIGISNNVFCAITIDAGIWGIVLEHFNVMPQIDRSRPCSFLPANHFGTYSSIQSYFIRSRPCQHWLIIPTALRSSIWSYHTGKYGWHPMSDTFEHLIWVFQSRRVDILMINLYGIIFIRTACIDSLYRRVYLLWVHFSAINKLTNSN